MGGYRSAGRRRFSWVHRVKTSKEDESATSSCSWELCGHRVKRTTPGFILHMCKAFLVPGTATGWRLAMMVFRARPCIGTTARPPRLPPPRPRAGTCTTATRGAGFGAPAGGGATTGPQHANQHEKVAKNHLLSHSASAFQTVSCALTESASVSVSNVLRICEKWRYVW